MNIDAGLLADVRRGDMLVARKERTKIWLRRRLDESWMESVHVVLDRDVFVLVIDVSDDYGYVILDFGMTGWSTLSRLSRP